MAIFRHTKDLPAAARGAVVVIGNFDGVHRGHQLLLADARRQADALGAPLAVLTFEPHPRSVFLPDTQPFPLTPLPAKAHALQEAGIDAFFFSPLIGRAWGRDRVCQSFGSRWSPFT